MAIFSERYIPNETSPVSMRTNEQKNFGFENNIFGRKVRKRFDRIYPRIKR